MKHDLYFLAWLINRRERERWKLFNWDLARNSDSTKCNSDFLFSEEVCSWHYTTNRSPDLRHKFVPGTGSWDLLCKRKLYFLRYLVRKQNSRHLSLSVEERLFLWLNNSAYMKWYRWLATCRHHQSWNQNSGRSTLNGLSPFNEIT